MDMTDMWWYNAPRPDLKPIEVVERINRIRILQSAPETAMMMIDMWERWDALARELTGKDPITSGLWQNEALRNP